MSIAVKRNKKSPAAEPAPADQTQTKAKVGFFNLQAKLAVLLVVFAIVPLAIVYGFLQFRTGDMEEKLGSQISSMQSVTQDAVDAIKGITETIERINEIAGGIAAAVEEQGAATQEIARNVQEASKGTQDVSQNIVGVTQAAQETGKASEDLLNASGELAQRGEQLKSEIGEFMKKIGAA